MIDTAIGGMKTRFIHGGKNPTLLVLASSKRGEKSFLEEHMKKKLKSEGTNVKIVDEPVWKVKPKGTYSEKTFRVGLGNKFLQSIVIPDEDDSQTYIDKGYKILDVPIDFKADFMDEIDRALCDFAGVSSSDISKYISGQAVAAIKTARYQNPFVKEVLEIGNAPDDLVQYKDFFDISRIPEDLRYKPLFIHLDMSISGDMTGIAGIFIKGKRPSVGTDQANDLFFSLGFSVAIKAPKGRQISFEKNRNFIYWLKEQGFSIKGITSDTFQSYDTGQTLLSKGYPYEILSVDRVEDRICLTGDTKIQTITGEKCIKDIIPGDLVKSFNTITNNFEFKPVNQYSVNPGNKIYTINCNNKTISCTPNHLILTARGYIKAKDLQKTDLIIGEKT